MNEIALYSATTPLLSSAFCLALAQPTVANSCHLPSHLDRTGILSRTRGIVHNTEHPRKQARGEATRCQTLPRTVRLSPHGWQLKCLRSQKLAKAVPTLSYRQYLPTRQKLLRDRQKNLVNHLNF